MPTSALPVSSSPLFGQAWELTVTSVASGSTVDNPQYQQTTISYVDWLPEALRITFDVVQTANTAPLWFADISIYNLDNQTQRQLVLNATWVTLKAGFQAPTSPNYLATIWSGPVFQTIYTREYVVDQKITLHCVANPLLMDDIVSFSMGVGGSQAQLLARMMNEVNAPPVGLGQVAAQRVQATQYPRGTTVFGRLNKYFNQIADSNFLQSWIGTRQAYISELGDTGATGALTPNLIYSPAFPPGGTNAGLGLPAGTTQSIIGTPEQIDQGVVFTVLLDPRLQVQLPPLLVQLVRTVINQSVRNPQPTGGDSYTLLVPPNSPDAANLLFYVSQVRHTGDTRGQMWQTEVTGFSTAYAAALLAYFTP
jgi:hypothetical protein